MYNALGIITIRHLIEINYWMSAVNRQTSNSNLTMLTVVKNTSVVSNQPYHSYSINIFIELWKLYVITTLFTLMTVTFISLSKSLWILGTCI